MELTPPNEKKPFLWPLALNLGLLVLATLITGAHVSALAVVVVVLAIINGVAAVLLHLSGKLNYVVAFLLSALLVLLIGLGICALLLSSLGSMR